MRRRKAASAAFGLLSHSCTNTPMCWSCGQSPTAINVTRWLHWRAGADAGFRTGAGAGCLPFVTVASLGNSKPPAAEPRIGAAAARTRSATGLPAVRCAWSC